MKGYPAEYNDGRAEFVLHSPLTTKKPWRGNEPENTRQALLLSGMDCLPGQQDLFAIDSQSEE
jgi:hypothetical protein